VNRAIDHIEANLDRPIRLVEVAASAGISAHHFHRVFQAMMGETVADFSKRLRLDRALVMMAHGGNRALADVALACGFSSASDFSRAFKQRFATAPSRFDLNTWKAEQRAKLEATVVRAGTPARRASSVSRANPDGFSVRIRDLPARTVAYIRVRDPYKPGAVMDAQQKLVAWAERHGLAGGQWLGYQWENPEITPLEQCRYHVAVEADRFTPAGEIGRYRFGPMVVAQVEVRGGIELELRALQWLYGTWLPRSGYVPDDAPAFEAWIGRPFAHGVEHFELNIQLPIKRAVARK
jgi:AraC family transcriptional regulator